MKVLLFGIGGHAKVIAEAILAQGIHTIAGCISDTGEAYTLLPNIIVQGSNANALDVAKELEAEGCIIALGDSIMREKFAQKLSGHLSFPTIIHPAAWVSPSACIGEGAVVMAGAVVQAGTTIGKQCIINTCAGVDHDCVIGDFTHVCPGVTIAGHVTVGEKTWIGAGSTVVDHVRIDANTFIKAGTIVTAPRTIGH